MLATLLSIGGGLCADAALKSAISTVGLPIAKRIAVECGKSVISIGVGYSFDQWLESMKPTALALAERAAGLNVIGEIKGPN